MSLSASPVPQIGIPGVRHSTFESLRLGRNFVIHGFIPVGRANHYMSSLKAGSIVKIDRFEVVRCGWANPFCPGLWPYQKNNSSPYPSPH
ncbi:hypothetical protein F2Q69_00038831 [Brassica cretica]|uniref:Uncharacterized protein n=1 Tax=Brassica cretica TaxID=69181 RepID=A0A8S9SM99_BRACR|nr:hypothetical protein F2Q69_00038831 [Brassica cretica]